MSNTFTPDDFTGSIPLFPMPNVVLFPGVGLPLHIFEPRYRALMDDALATDRLIGLVLLRTGWEENYYDTPAIHRIGCLGEIDGEEKLPDGRWNMILRGHARFRIDAELTSQHPYRTARVSLLPEPELLEPADALSLRTSQLMMSVWRFLGESSETRALMGRLFPGDILLPRLVDRVAAALAFDPEMKQRILETQPPLERLDLLLAALDSATPDEPPSPESDDSDDEESDEDEGNGSPTGSSGHIYN